MVNIRVHRGPVVGGHAVCTRVGSAPSAWPGMFRMFAPEVHVARIRPAIPAEVDTWVRDAMGGGVLVWNAASGASLVGELRTVVKKVRALVGGDARPAICFDRGGWSPKLFKELTVAGGLGSPSSSTTRRTR